MLTRFDQGQEAERFEVGIGEPHREGFTSGEMPGSTAATGRIAQLTRDSERDQCRSATPWCFPQRVDSLVMLASENLHISGHQ